MKRKITMLLLGLGAIAGFGAGFGAVCNMHGPGRLGRHDFERRVADTCADAALRVYEQKNGRGARP